MHQVSESVLCTINGGVDDAVHNAHWMVKDCSSSLFWLVESDMMATDRLSRMKCRVNKGWMW